MGVDGGGGRRSMTQITLDDAQIDTGFQQMSCVRMSEAMHCRSFVDAALDQCGMESSLHCRFMHGLFDFFGTLPIFTEGRKQPYRISMSEPVLAQHLQTGFRQRRVTI